VAGETVVVRKYANRRLYDTSSSRYINLDDVARLVRDGVDVQVVDAANGEDLTRAVLTQIIVEAARKDEDGLPIELLRQMVAASDESMQEFLNWYLDTAMEGYRRAREAFSEHVRQFGRGPWTPFEMTAETFDPARMMQWFSSPRPSSSPEPAEEVEELRRRLAEMERRMEELVRHRGDEPGEDES
jgi:polyhydroxyalkanoate synthesis repressor PhaR